jgi:hypothetical protein
MRFHTIHDSEEFMMYYDVIPCFPYAEWESVFTGVSFKFPSHLLWILSSSISLIGVHEK